MKPFTTMRFWLWWYGYPMWRARRRLRDLLTRVFVCSRRGHNVVHSFELMIVGDRGERATRTSCLRCARTLNVVRHQDVVL